VRKLKILTSLTTIDNDYQIEQASSAQETALRLGVVIELVYADNDSITQSQQLLKAIQLPKESRPDAIILEPAGGTGLPRVAQAAADAGIGWVVVNWDAEYLDQLRRQYTIPLFAVTSDHREVGRIQGRQIAALLPGGGSVLCIQGPSYSPAAQQRSEGMQETKPGNMEVKFLRGKWTDRSAYEAVNTWLRLSSSRNAPIQAVAAQDDSMAMGAREAFLATYDAERWLSLPFIGCDGVPKTGQTWVRRGYMAATVVIPPNIGLAIELLVREFRSGLKAPVRTLTVPKSFPSLEGLAVRSHEGSSEHEEETGLDSHKRETNLVRTFN
jgi:ABC-type sugar transport system substrate-binding protein